MERRTTSSERRNTSTMASTTRPGSIARTSMRPGVRNTTASASTRQRQQQPPTRTHASLLASRIDRAGAASPADSLLSVATSATKRKERDFDAASAVTAAAHDEGEATNINVVVRCRGRSEREVRENSAVVVSTEGVKGKLVELSMGPSALSNKTYSFDRVFSPAADQSMIFDDVVKPILDEMLAGYNCTIFAYGQTGTGKTYTMSGDMSETFGLLSDAAGIIPRVLHALFNKLEIDDTDHCVACSFIELYNEELRDLLAVDEGTKLKIYDDNSRKGHATTVVQGMEERHITSAAEGLRWLQEGSVRRQVAATKCNDLSSRSHTVFTISVYIKTTTGEGGGGGEDYLSAGKLNLVDLAGSENIQRSGAENKRATEAGLINKSLLTLGRVINALVDRSAHIPYRESKLTRLLQDSLGGRTKTCIIATVSPAKSNLEETISTLDYAFRAKNIRNKPQVNALINKKALLREFTIEIEKLKSELIATRQRNGVYLSNEAYEELTVQNESRRILTEEQGAKIETLETNLRTKVQELFHLTSSFMGLRKEHDGTRAQLEATEEVLGRTDLVLAATRRTLAEEAHLRRAHEATEAQLSALGGELLTTLKTTVDHVGGLRAKNKRKSDLQSLNRSTWAMSQAQVAGVAGLVEARLDAFRADQEARVAGLAGRVQTFTQQELAKLAAAQARLDRGLAQLAGSRDTLTAQADSAKDEMDGVLDEIRTVRDATKQRVGLSLSAIAAAAEKITGNVLAEMGAFHDHLHASYGALGKEFKSAFEDLLRRLAAQRAESDRLRAQLEDAATTAAASNSSVAERVQAALDEERAQQASERAELLAQIAALVNSQSERREARVAGRAALVRQAVLETGKSLGDGVAQYAEGMDAWAAEDGRIVAEVATARDALRDRLREDWTIASAQSTSIQTTTRSVHAETVRAVEEQQRDLDAQMHDLDDFVARARTHNAAHRDRHAASVQNLARAAETDFFAPATSRLVDAETGLRDLDAGVAADARDLLLAALEPMDEGVCEPLRGLREDIQATALREYEPTGDTPEKREFAYPTVLPRTGAHEALIARLHEEARERGEEQEEGEQEHGAVHHQTPSRINSTTGPIFSDLDLSRLPGAGASAGGGGGRPTSRGTVVSAGTSASTASNASITSLREVNPNVTITGAGVSASSLFDPGASVMSLPPVRENATMPVFVGSTGIGTGGEAAAGTTGPRRRSTRSQVAKFAKKQLPSSSSSSAVGALALEGRENVPPVVGPRRKSPRLH